MDHRSARAEDTTGPGRLARDLALCLAVHLDRSPAVVWPDCADAVLSRFPGAPRRPAGRPPADTGPGTPPATRLATRLGDLLGRRVDASYLDLPAGSRRPGGPAAADRVLLPVRGGCRARLEPAPPGPCRAVLEHPLELRLLAGEALYVPRGIGCALHEVRSPGTLLVLTLRPPSW
ncbi:hypothetical protein [Streptomyces sp. NPDC047000]|uniref:hypothetical protein n=1 Tax=Streptomyces sp. NPDC047000 TaxID=3155474 RepID=UPI0034045269